MRAAVICAMALLVTVGCRGLRGVPDCKDLDVPREYPVVEHVLPCPSDDVPVAFFMCKRPADDAVGTAEHELTRRVRCEDGCQLAFTLTSSRLVDEVDGCMLKKAETGFVYAVEGTARCLGH